MHLKTKFITGFAAAAALSLTGLASATPSTDQEIQAQSFGFALSPGSQNLEFDLFDDQGGTRILQSVEIQIDGTIGANVTATNTSSIPAEFFSLELSGNLQASFGGLNATALYSVVETVPEDDLPVMPGQTWDFGAVSDSDSASNTTMMNLNDFIGVGTMNATVNGSGGFAVQGVADAIVNFSDFQANGEMTVIYNYKMAVPAPGALALLGIAGLVGTRRRR